MKSIFRPLFTMTLLLASSTAAQEKLNLRFNLQPQTEYLYTIDMNQTNTQTVDGEEQRLKQQMILVIEFDVLKRDSDNITEVGLTYKRVKIDQDYGHQIVQFDSDVPPEFLDPSMKGMAALPGTYLLVRYSPKGKVVDIDGIDRMLDKMIAAMELPEKPEKEKIIANLRKQYGDDAIRQQIEQLTEFYPDKTVAVGDTWKNEIAMSSGFPMQIKSSYALQSRSDGIGTITVSSTVSSNPQDRIEMGPLSMAYDVKGTQSGKIQVEESTGLAIRSEVNLQFSGQVNVSGVPNEEAQSWPVSADGTVIVTIEKQTE
jgi:hypothetical protein